MVNSRLIFEIVGSIFSLNDEKKEEEFSVIKEVLEKFFSEHGLVLENSSKNVPLVSRKRGIYNSSFFEINGIFKTCDSFCDAYEFDWNYEISFEEAFMNELIEYLRERGWGLGIESQITEIK